MDRRTLCLLAALELGLAPSWCPGAYDQAILRDGSTVEGMVRLLDASGRFEFSRRQRGPAVPFGQLAELRLRSMQPRDRGVAPAHCLVIRGAQTLTGRFSGADRHVLYWSGFARGPIAVRREHVAALLRRNAQQVVLQEGFETGLGRWVATGEAKTAADRIHSGKRVLRLGGQTGAVQHVLRTPIRAGQVSLYFCDGLDVDPGLEFYVRLDFSSAWGGPRRLKVILGWQELRYAVRMSNFESVPVRERVRQRGWRHLVVRFGSEGLSVTIDRQVLVRTSEPVESVLRAVCVGAARTGRRRPVGTPRAVGWIDDLALVRCVETQTHRHADTTQDEVLLVSGDQLFGTVSSLDEARVKLDGAFGPAVLGWDGVFGVYFGRRTRPPQVLDGTLVAVWARHGDAWWGALHRLDLDALEMTTTFAGRFKIPRAAVRHMKLLFRGRRYEIDDDYHHLGNSFDQALRVPRPEGVSLVRRLRLAGVPDKAFTAASVVHMLGTGPEEDPEWREQLSKGRLRTTLRINGQVVGALNDHVSHQSDDPVRIRIPVPAGLLRKGDNTFEIRTSPQAVSTQEYDDFGLWGLALEVEK